MEESGDKCRGSTIREPKALLTYVSVVSVLMGKLTIFLRFNHPVLLRNPGYLFFCPIVH